MRLAQSSLRLFSGMSLGVRGAVFDHDGRVLLVRHTYTPGWHLPGGGVKPGEAVTDALARELKEECGVALSGQPELFGVYRNPSASRRDHVLLFVCLEWHEAGGPAAPNLEIAEHGFFSPRDLPHGTTAGTRRRLAEIRDGAARLADW